jgi:cytoplasmic FMR1 interacting protein
VPLYGNTFVKDSISQAIKQMETAGKSLEILALGIENPTNLQYNNNLVTNFLSSLKKTLLDLKGQKLGQLENPRTFFRIWSALQFAICFPPPPSNEFAKYWTNREIFGDGLQYAGCTCIHLLSQVSLFVAYDFNNHILSVDKLEKQPAASQQTNIQGYSGVFDINASSHTEPTLSYLENASFMANLNEEIFDFLENKNI